MTHPKFRKTKVYEVALDRPLEPLHQQMISDYGVMLDDGPSKFMVVRATECLSRVASPRPVATGEARLSSRCRAPEALRETSPQPSYLVTLSEGRNRQIRRTFAALGYKVVKLHRIAFGKYELSGLEPGKCVIIKP